MSLFNIESTNNRKSYNLNTQLLKNKNLINSSRNINANKGTINDLNFSYQQNLLEESNKLQNNKFGDNFSKNIKSISNLLSILNVQKDIKGNLDNLYKFANNSNLDDRLDDVLKGMHKATKTVKGLFKGLF